jgi:hypothetical protein
MDISVMDTGKYRKLVLPVRFEDLHGGGGVWKEYRS